MTILLTNDDGIESQGITVLYDILSKKHDVFIFCPDSNRSAISHGINMYNPVTVNKLSDNKYTCSGTPVDCVFNAVRSVMKTAPDVVISGINKGANLGTDIIYSGTAAAARQAALFGISGIALSIYTKSQDEKYQFDAMAEFVSENLETLKALATSDFFVNINALSLNAYKGVKYARLSKRKYADGELIYTSPMNKMYSFFVGGKVTNEGDENCDTAVSEKGYIAVSRVFAEPVAEDFQNFERLKFKI
jgi:5'-nucleotidase